MKKKFIAGMLVTVTVMGTAFAYVSTVQRDVSKASYSKEVSSVIKDKDTDSRELDAIYKDVEEEEQYIAKLVSKKTGKKVNINDWTLCLSYLEANYDTLINDKSIDTEKVKSYVEAYRIVKSEKNDPESKINVTNKTAKNSTSKTKTSEIATAATAIATGENDENYDVKKVKKYLQTYYKTFNPKYPNYTGHGGDCANFVSQALYAGGKKMKGTNVSSLNNWFCRTSKTEEFNKVSSTWRGAEAFACYWKKNALEYKEFATYSFSSRKRFKDVYNYADEGDAISFIKPTGRAYHTVIVSYKNRLHDGEIRFAAHTSSQIDRSLYKYVHGSSYSKVRIYKMSYQNNPNEENKIIYNYADKLEKDKF